MMLSMLIISPMVIFFSIISLMLTRKHLLMCLLNLEVMILGLVLLSSSFFYFFSSDNPLLMLILLTLGACEASLGLSCLVKMSRSFGNDSLFSLSTIMC